MTNGVAAEPQLTRATAEQLVGYAFGATRAPARAPDVKAAGDQFRAGDSETALKIVTGDLLPYTEQDTKKTLISHLSTNRGVDGRKVIPTDANENRRFNKSNSVAQDIRQFVEKGIITPNLRSILENYLVTNNQAVADIYERSGYARYSIKPIVDTILEDPVYKDELRQLFNTRLDPTKKLIQEDTVRQLETQIAELNAQLGTQVDPQKLKEAQLKVKQIESQMALDPKYQEYAQKFKRYESIGKRVDTYEVDLERYEGSGRPLVIQRQSLDQQLRDLEQNKPQNYDAEKSRINKQIQAIESHSSYIGYVTAASQIQLYEQLKSDLPDLAKDILPLQERLNEATLDLEHLNESQKRQIVPEDRAKIEAQLNQKKAELADAKDQLEAEMIKFARDVTHMPQDAAEAYINTAFNKLKTNWQEEAKKKTEKEKSDQENLAQIAVDKLTNQWREDTIERGTPVKKANKDRALNFLTEVFKPGGVANVESRISGLTDPQLAALGLTPQEITAFKAKWSDTEYRKIQADALAKQAMADYFLAGGRMSQNMVVALATSPWGLELLEQGRARANEILAKAKGHLGKNVLGRMDEVKQQLDEMKNSSADFIKNNWWKFGLAILILLIFLGIKGAAF